MSASRNDSHLSKNEHGILQLIEHLNEADDDGMLPLMLAISTGQMTMARTLIESGADCNACDEGGFSLLAQAIQRGSRFRFAFPLILCDRV